MKKSSKTENGFTAFHLRRQTVKKEKLPLAIHAYPLLFSVNLNRSVLLGKAVQHRIHVFMAIGATK